MNIERHVVDPDFMKGMQNRFEGSFDSLPSFVDGAKRTPVNLSLLASEAWCAMSYGSLVEPDSRKLSTALELAAQSHTALFAAATAASNKESVTVKLGNEPVTYSSAPDESTVHVGRWLEGFYFDVIYHDAPTFELMCKTPVNLLKNSSTSGSEYLYLYMETLRAFGNQNATGLPEKILAALKATDPNRPDIHSTNVALELHVPELEVFMYMVTQDPKFNEALAKAVQLHKKFWSRKKNCRSYEGFISVPLTALAVLGKERGLLMDVESPYLAVQLAPS